MAKAITVLAFGAITDIVGKRSFELNGVASTDEVKTKLESEFPALKNIPYTVAVNGQTVAAAAALDDRATVALLPPFSGG